MGTVQGQDSTLTPYNGVHKLANGSFKADIRIHGKLHYSHLFNPLDYADPNDAMFAAIEWRKEREEKYCEVDADYEYRIKEWHRKAGEKYLRHNPDALEDGDADDEGEVGRNVDLSKRANTGNRKDGASRHLQESKKEDVELDGVEGLGNQGASYKPRMDGRIEVQANSTSGYAHISWIRKVEKRCNPPKVYEYWVVQFNGKGAKKLTTFTPSCYNGDKEAALKAAVEWRNANYKLAGYKHDNILGPYRGAESSLASPSARDADVENLDVITSGGFTTVTDLNAGVVVVSSTNSSSSSCSSSCSSSSSSSSSDGPGIAAKAPRKETEETAEDPNLNNPGIRTSTLVYGSCCTPKADTNSGATNLRDLNNGVVGNPNSSTSSKSSSSSTDSSSDSNTDSSGSTSSSDSSSTSSSSSDSDSVAKVSRKRRGTKKEAAILKR